MIVSAIDDIPGLGPTRKKRLLKELGSVKKMRDLEEADFLALPWLPEAVGKAVYAKLHGVERGR